MRKVNWAGFISIPTLSCKHIKLAPEHVSSVDNRQTSCSISIYVKCVCAPENLFNCWILSGSRHVWVFKFAFWKAFNFSLHIWEWGFDGGFLYLPFQFFPSRPTETEKTHIIFEFEQVEKASLHPGWCSIRWPFHSGKSPHFSSFLLIRQHLEFTHDCWDIKENPKKSIHTRDEY